MITRTKTGNETPHSIENSRKWSRVEDERFRFKPKWPQFFLGWVEVSSTHTILITITIFSEPLHYYTKVEGGDVCWLLEITGEKSPRKVVGLTSYWWYLCLITFEKSKHLNQIQETNKYTSKCKIWRFYQFFSQSNLTLWTFNSARACNAIYEKMT